MPYSWAHRCIAPCTPHRKGVYATQFAYALSQRMRGRSHAPMPASAALVTEPDVARYWMAAATAFLVYLCVMNNFFSPSAGKKGATLRLWGHGAVNHVYEVSDARVLGTSPPNLGEVFLVVSVYVLFYVYDVAGVHA